METHDQDTESMNRSLAHDNFAAHENTETLGGAPALVGAINEAFMHQKLYTLSEFTNTFDLPQIVKVAEGRHGTTEVSMISKDTVLLLCSQKTKKVLLTVDAHSITQDIPCDSTSEYAVLDTLYGFEGHVYNSVNELLCCSDLPQVVHVDADTASNLYLQNSNQLIFPCQKDQDILGRNCLVCYDQRNTKFKLPAAKRGTFSTKPGDIKMDIPSCIKHIKEFPYSIAKYNSDGKMFPIVDASILTVTGTDHKQHVMAKILSGVGKDDTTIIEIPLDSPIKVQCLQTENLQTNENRSSTPYQDVDMFQNPSYTSDITSKPRMLLPGQYMALTNSNAKPTTYEHLTSKPPSHDRETFPRQNAKLHRQFSTPVQRRHSALVDAAQSQIHTSEGALIKNYGEATYTTILPPDVLYDDVINPLVSYEQPQEFQQIQRLEASNRKLLIEVAQLQACVNELVHLVVTKNPENNIRQLSSMDTDTIVMMLRTMGLSEYEHIFRKKEINGKKLANLDRKKLSQYGITDIKDQEGLKDLIKGKVSPLTYLLRLPSNTSTESYAQFTKTFRKLNQYY